MLWAFQIRYYFCKIHHKVWDMTLFCRQCKGSFPLNFKFVVMSYTQWPDVIKLTFIELWWMWQRCHLMLWGTSYWSGRKYLIWDSSLFELPGIWWLMIKYDFLLQRNVGVLRKEAKRLRTPEDHLDLLIVANKPQLKSYSKT